MIEKEKERIVDLDDFSSSSSRSACRPMERIDGVRTIEDDDEHDDDDGEVDDDQEDRRRL